MRINSGAFKYRKIVLPEDIRPTTEKVREAMFSMIFDDIEEAEVVDLFAGSGVLGLEALSRGAAHCVFNDTDRKHVAIIRENIENCKAMNQSTVVNRDFRKCLRGLKGPVDIIIMDPPYYSGYYDEAFEIIDSEGLLREGGIVVAEHLYEISLQECYGNLRRYKEKRYGNIGLDLYVMDSEHATSSIEGENGCI